MKAYEGSVLEFYDNFRGDAKYTVSDLLFYCQSVEEFVRDLLSEHSQNTWVRRFVVHYSGEAAEDQLSAEENNSLRGPHECSVGESVAVCEIVEDGDQCGAEGRNQILLFRKIFYTTQYSTVHGLKHKTRGSLWRPKQRLWIWTRKYFGCFGVINYNLNHCCAVAVDSRENKICICDPQQTGNRYKELRAYLKEELLSFLPQPKSPKRYRFKSVDYCTTQHDSYNCGIFILWFFQMCLYGDEPAGIEGNSSAAMQVSATGTLAIF